MYIFDGAATSIARRSSEQSEARSLELHFGAGLVLPKIPHLSPSTTPSPLTFSSQLTFLLCFGLLLTLLATPTSCTGDHIISIQLLLPSEDLSEEVAELGVKFLDDEGVNFFEAGFEIEEEGVHMYFE